MKYDTFFEPNKFSKKIVVKIKIRPNYRKTSEVYTTSEQVLLDIDNYN